jgi:hypothetical protein
MSGAMEKSLRSIEWGRALGFLLVALLGTVAELSLYGLDGSGVGAPGPVVRSPTQRDHRRDGNSDLIVRAKTVR